MEPTRSRWQQLDALLARLRPWRQPLSLLVDGAMIALAWNVTYLFRLGFDRWISARPGYDGWVLLGIVALYLTTFALMRVPQGMWRFSGFGDIKRLTIACIVAGLVSAVVIMLLGLTKVPRAVLALHPVVALMAVCVVRIAYRMVYEHARKQIAGGGDAPERRALVVGAGEAARLLLAGIHHQGWTVVGLLDDDASKHGARISGVPVLGAVAGLQNAAQQQAATHVVIALPSARAAERRRVFDAAAATHLPVLTVPSIEEIRSGQQASRLRDIEPEDLLGREPVVLDDAGIGSVLHGKTVLITGAGGSIGSELCRQVARFAPAKLVLYELNEFNLYSIEQELSQSYPALGLVRLIGDVKDLEHLRVTFAAQQPQVVFHAAAYKHVPLMEEDHNAWQCLRNNVLGTYHAALAAAEAKCERFVLISTDKAVNPTNVMGATKRAAEMVISAMAVDHLATKFMAVRFGNVLGSSGSVIPKFKEQIAKGGPVTVTHPDIIRYFMTIPEASRLVLQAAALGQTGQVLVLDMGEPVKIVDLAQQLIRLSGHSPQEIAIEFSGLRPGEKLYEELLADADQTLATPVPQLRIAKMDASTLSAQRLQSLVSQLASGALAAPAEIRLLLVELVPAYRAPGQAHQGPR